MPGRKDRSPNTLWLITLVVLMLAFMVGIIIGPRGFRHLSLLKKERGRILVMNQEIEKENKELYQKIQQFQKDPRMMEQIIRQELGWVGEDELVFIFKEDQPRFIKR